MASADEGTTGNKVIAGAALGVAIPAAVGAVKKLIGSDDDDEGSSDESTSRQLQPRLLLGALVPIAAGALPLVTAAPRLPTEPQRYSIPAPRSRPSSRVAPCSLSALRRYVSNAFRFPVMLFALGHVTSADHVGYAGKTEE